jgi:hypothetical protein
VGHLLIGSSGHRGIGASEKPNPTAEGGGATRSHLNAAPIWGWTAQTHANLGWLGMTSVKSFGILVEGQGEG